MKKTAMIFVLLGFTGGLAAPALASGLGGDSAVLFEQMKKCKDNEKWDEKTKKCVKKEQ